jgi:hypothetical protein
MSPRRGLIAVAIVGVAVVAAALSAGRVFGAKEESAFKNDTEKASYAVGVNLARQLKTLADSVDERALVAGFNDARSGDGKTRLTNQEINAALATLRASYHQNVAAAQVGAKAPATNTPGISVFFKMDPRLTASYGGDRWVSPPTYTRVGDANGAVIDARVQIRAAAADLKPALPEWSSSDPAMVQVTPEKGGAVKITVKRAGATNVRITSGTITKELSVKAEPRDNALHVEISQK